MIEAPIRDGQLIRPRMAMEGGYHMECCDCGLVHRLDFSITPENGLELRVYCDEEKTFNARLRCRIHSGAEGSGAPAGSAETRAQRNADASRNE
jgi:hypothetical protein